MCINKPRMKATDNVALEFSQGFSMTGWAWFFFFSLLFICCFCSSYLLFPLLTGCWWQISHLMIVEARSSRT